MDVLDECGGNATVYVVPGPRLDVASVAEFRTRVGAIIDEGASRLVIDMSEIAFLDSSGLGALVGAMKRAGRRGTVEIANVRPEVMKVFRLTRMDQVFRINAQRPAA